MKAVDITLLVLPTQPLPQEQLLAKIKLLKKNKSKSVESSPVTTPRHVKHPVWQLSLRGNSKTGLTESDSSGTDSPILLPRSSTPTPSPTSQNGTTVPPSGGGAAGLVPRVTVTTSETSLDSNHAHQRDSFTNSHSALLVATSPHGESSSESQFTDAVDGEVDLSNLNSDSAMTSDLDTMALLSSSNSSDSESNLELHGEKKQAAFARKPRSPSVVGLASDPSKDHSEEEGGITFKTRGGETEVKNSNGDALRGSELAGGISSALKQVLGIHPTRIGIWRLQRGERDY